MYKPLIFALSVCLFSVASAANVDSQAPIESKWQLVKREPSLVIYEREMPGSPVIAFKGEGTLDAPVDKVAAVLLDNARAKEWVDSLEESRVLRRIGPHEYIEYNHIGTPFVMKDRDFVTHVVIDVNAKAHKMTLKYKSVDDASAPATNYIRGDLINSRFTLEPLEDGKKTLLTAEIHADPKGSVPKWIVNMFQRGWPRDTFKGIQEQLKKSDLKTPADFADVIAELR